MNKNPASAVVIGGGVIGAMCAWELAGAGLKVIIVDREGFGSGCSHGNCGYVSPSHILPLTQPGTTWKTLKALTKRNSPFAVKPRFSGDFIRWFWNFTRRCNRRDMLQAAAGRHALLQSSKQLYEQLIESQNIDCEWQPIGLMFVYDDEQECEHFGKTDELLRNEFGVGAEHLSPAQLHEKEPALRSGLGGAWFYPCDSHLRPDKLMTALRGLLEAKGVEIVEYAPVDRFQRDGNRARAVAAGEKSIEGDLFVVATGAMTPFLNDHLGCRIPIEPGKGYSLTMPANAQMPRFPIIFEQARVAVTPMKTKYRIGSTMEFVGFDDSINPRRLNLLKTAAEKYLVHPYCDPIEETWFGWRPMTWDGKPILDRSPAMCNVWIAAGHNMLGLSMATGTGRLMREMMLGDEPHIDPSHFTLARFQKS